MNIENRKSTIHGLGVFALESIEKGYEQTIYGMVTPTKSKYGFEIDGVTWWEPFPPFRYLNHLNPPNCKVIEYSTGEVTIITLSDICVGEELTIDYDNDGIFDDEN